MGVIDLDARVKKLEAGGGGGAEIDQIEADLTALENTVGGLIEDVSDKITLNDSITFAEGNPIVVISRVGNICFLNIKGEISEGASAAGSDTTIGTIAAGYRPVSPVSVWCAGTSDSDRRAFIDTDGTIKERGGNWFRFEAFWTIATPEPTP